MPQRWKENPPLAEWVSKQRSAYKRKLLAPDQIQDLEGLGFEWDPIGMWWEEMFRELVEFKEKHGHTNVPQNSVEYGKLGRWVQKQRADHRINRPILAVRRKRLDQIGFVWRLVEPNSWDEMFARLVE